MTKKGVTIIEVIAGTAIIVLILALTYQAFVRFNRGYALRTSADTVRSVLEEARTQTLAGADDSVHGVHFEADRVVRFKGTTYNMSDPENVTTLLHPLVELSTISLSGGGSEVVFDRLTGKTAHTGTLMLTLRSDDSFKESITISVTGAIERD